MKTFTTISGTTFTTNESETYFYVIQTKDGNQTKKRIKKAQFEEAQRMHELEVEARMHENLDTMVLDAKMEKMGYHRIPSEWNDIRYSTCDGMSKVMAWNTVEEGMEWVESQITEEDVEAAIAETEESITTEAINEYDQWAAEAEAGYQARKAMQEEKDRETEANYKAEGNGKIGLGDNEHEGLHVDFTPEEEDKAMKEAEEWIKRRDAEKRQKKERKPRKSKDIAHEWSNGGVNITLTAKQVDFIHHLPDTMYWEQGLDSEIWVDCLCDDIKGQFANKPMTVGAMISTLCEKGLGIRSTTRREKKKCTSFRLTPLGQAVARDLGLK